MHKFISKKNFKTQLDLIKKSDENIDALLKCGIDLNSKIIENLFSLQSNNIAFLEFLMNDEYENISWFIYENDWGKKKYTISWTKSENKEFVIDSVDALYNYLKNWNNKNTKENKNEQN